MDIYVCRGCGADAEEIANIAPTIRHARSVTQANGSLRAQLDDALEVEDSRGGFIWQCQSCGYDGFTLEQVLEVDAA